jgi:hypothetical protein
MKKDLYKLLTKDMSYTNRNSFTGNMFIATLIILGVMAAGCIMALAMGYEMKLFEFILETK